MEISLNNLKRSINSSNLFALLNEVLGEKTKGTAVAVNDTVVPKTEWEKYELKENDKVIIIKATQGG
jgi:sulfur carrier protein